MVFLLVSPLDSPKTGTLNRKQAHLSLVTGQWLLTALKSVHELTDLHLWGLGKGRGGRELKSALTKPLIRPYLGLILGSLPRLLPPPPPPSPPAPMTHTYSSELPTHYVAAGR